MTRIRNRGSHDSDMMRIAFCLLLGAQLASAAQRYVNPAAGTDAGAGSISAPWRTIRYGILNMDGGDTLWLRGGTYTDSGIPSGDGARIKSGPSSTQFTRIVGYPGELALWKPTSTDYLITIGRADTIRSNIWIGGFAIDGVNRLTSVNPFIGVQAFQNIVITNIMMTNSSGVAAIMSMSNADQYGGSYLTIVSNVVNGWGRWRQDDSDPHALYVRGTRQGLIIRGNKLINTHPDARPGSRAIHLYDHLTSIKCTNAIIEGNYMLVRDGSTVLGPLVDSAFRNNVCISMGDSPVGANIAIGYQGTIRTRIDNNTIYGGYYGISLRGSWSQDRTVFRNNLLGGPFRADAVYNESANPSYWTNNVMSGRFRGPSTTLVLSGNRMGTDPRFVNPPSDLHLIALSPGIDFGTPLPGIVTHDIEGRRRPQGNAWDAGAYELPDPNDNEATPVEYTLTVNNGTGSGSYSAGSSVDLVAANAPAGQQFYRWTGDVGTVANVNAASTTLTMPADDTTVAATYRAVSVGGTFTFLPTADAYLQGTTRYNDAYLKVEAGRRVAYLKFNVSGLAGSVRSATLQLRENGDVGSGTLRVYRGSHNSWTETTLTTANAPSANGQVGTSSGSVSAGQVVNINVTSLVPDDGTYTAIIKMDAGGNDVWFGSEESARKPRLIVETSGTTALSLNHYVGGTPGPGEELVLPETDGQQAVETREDSETTDIPPQPPRLRVERISPAELELGWEINPGSRCEIQERSSLNEAVWTTVFTTSTTTGNLRIPIVTETSSAYFRIVLTE